ncbi:hypothetical protein HUA76_20130 [Myxococcus sp. CA056]|uniref:hypothetical protein n=1 Tax=Myxococcus sp. CA056 TaxID=2741740 RepID=UPI00157B724C|nr:hypothetical protein [Myxococcus sp. CA056]NTX13113.1 hypothetical protein [Myxococcus sp. CA056]
MSDEQDPKGPPSPRGEQQQDAASGKNQTGRVLAQHFWEELQKGAVHFQEQGSEVVPRGRLRQFIHGLSLPFHIARALLGDPVARRQYLRVGLMQTVVALALSLTCMGSANKAANAVEDSQDEAVAAEVSSALKKVASVVAEQNARKAERAAARELRKQRRNGEAPADTARATAAAELDSDAQDEEASEAEDPADPDAVALAPGADEAPQVQAGKVDTNEAGPPERDAKDGETPSELAADVSAAPAREREPTVQGKNTDAAPTSDKDKSPREPSQATADEEDPEARLAMNIERRLRDIEAAANNPDAGTAVSDAVMALVAEAVSSASSDASSVQPRPKKPEGDSAKAGKVKSEPGKSPRQRHPEAEDKGSTGPTFKGFSVVGIPFWIALFAAMQLAQWVIIALSRDYHDVISREASLLTRVEPEDDAITPHIRLNVQWMRKKVRRRVRAMILFAVGVPAAAFVVSPFFCLGLSSPLITTITSLWGAWWLMVFTAAKSAQAWEPMAGQRPPWFLRAWTFLTTRVPGLRWNVLQRYGAMWTRRSTEVFVPVATVERHPWAYAGLTVVRFVGSFAPLKFFVRPLIPVASAHILREESARRAREGQGTGSSPRVPGPLEETIRSI